MIPDILANGLATASRDTSRPKTKTERLEERLSDRENQVLQLLIGGFDSREIARRLNISARTVEIYRILIDQKLDEANSAFSDVTGRHPITGSR